MHGETGSVRMVLDHGVSVDVALPSISQLQQQNSPRDVSPEPASSVEKIDIYHMAQRELLSVGSGILLVDDRG